LQDARDSNDELEGEIAQRLPARTPVLKVFNKIDLLEGERAAAVTKSRGGASSAGISHSATTSGEIPNGETTSVRTPGEGTPTETSSNGGPARQTLYISAKTGQSLDALRQR